MSGLSKINISYQKKTLIDDSTQVGVFARPKIN